MVDFAGTRALAQTRRSPGAEGVLVAVRAEQGPPGGDGAAVTGVSQQMEFFLAHQNKADLGVLRELLEAGRSGRPSTGQTALSYVAEAIAYLE